VTTATELNYFELPSFELQSGVIVDLRLAYRCYGKLSNTADNTIVFPTYYTGNDLSNLAMIGSEHALNPEEYFIVVPNLFGNGVSSSPSKMSANYAGARFPKISVYDNVRAQALLLDHLGVKNIALVVGWSMGGLQAYQWAAQFPDRVERAMVICGAAKTAEHNQVFLKGLKATLHADHVFNEGNYQQTPSAGLKAFGRVYAGWAYSQAFFRNKAYKKLGFETAEDLLLFWEQDHLTWDANDLLAMLDTWLAADISNQPLYNGDLQQALAAINAQLWLVPCEQDLYFRYEDNLVELAYLKYGEYQGYQSELGHVSAGPGRFEAESQLINELIHRLLMS